MKITASLEVALEDQILVLDNIEHSYSEGGKTTTIVLDKGDFSGPSQVGNVFFYPSSKIEISISTYDEEIPTQPLDTKDSRSIRENEDFYQKYFRLCFEELKSFLSFLRYKRQQPIREGSYKIEKYSLFDERGNQYRSSAMGFSSPISKQAVNQDNLKIEVLDQSNIAEYSHSDTKGFEPSLSQKIMYEAQKAIIEKDLRRAVIDVAVATEIAILFRFTGPNSEWKSVVLDLVHESTGIGINPMFWINRVAETLGCSRFSDDHKNDNKSIQALFEGRNSVAHRGELSYLTEKYRAESRVEITKETVVKWYQSARLLMNWLDNLAEKNSSSVGS